MADAAILAIGNSLVTDLLEAYLEDAEPPIGVAKAVSLVQGLAVLELPFPVNLVLLCAPVAETDGVGAIRELRRRWPDLPVAILSGDASSQAIQAAIEAGACGIVSQRLPAPVCLATLRLLLTGERHFPEPEYEDRGSARYSAAETIVGSLTPREFETLMHLSQGRSNKEIAREMGIEIVTVTLHLTNLYRKLGVSSRARAIRCVVEAGLPAHGRWAVAKTQSEH